MLELIYTGEVLATVGLEATSSVEQNTFKAKMHVAASFFTSKEFLVAILIIVAITLTYSIIYTIKAQKKYMK